MAALPYDALRDWAIEYEDGVARRMVWLGLVYGPPCPPDVRPAPCRQHDRLTFPCDECAAHARAANR
jgi:hypothetical protein